MQTHSNLPIKVTWVFCFLMLVLASSTTVWSQEDGSEPRIVLVVDDSNKKSGTLGVEQILSDLGVQFEMWSTNDPQKKAQGKPQRPTIEKMQSYFATLWLTSGKFDEFDGPDARLVSNYLHKGGNLILMGAMTGNSLSWNFIDRDFFGFQYQGNLELPVKVIEMFGQWNGYLKTDFGGNVAGGCPFYFISPGAVRASSLKLAGVGHIMENGSRSVWLGFNFTDLPEEETRKRILSRCVWFLDYFQTENGLNPISWKGETLDFKKFQEPKK